MKKLIKPVAVILACVLILSALSGCTNNSEIKELLNNFESCCRKLDVRGMLSCFNPTVSDPILTVMTMLGVSDTSELLDNITPLLNNFGDLGVSAEEFFSSISITATDFDYGDDKTTCEVTAQIAYGDERSTEAVFSCVLKQGKWFITFIDFF